MMRSIIALVAIAGALGACSGDSAASRQTQSIGLQRPSDVESEAYMREAENAWAIAPLSQRIALLKRILAEDYVGVGTKGAVRNKSQTIAADSSMPSNPGKSAKLDYVHYHHFGDTVVSQGEETSSSSGKARQIVWIDVWMFRSGKWQVVASQEGVLQPPS